ncbi:zinc-ribbon and DUF3426 domain-containing protein [Variovorax sp. OV329]|uniref:zinc-ribbon and DUF3426 domain-containing protein n=1 Tax=Variovorax sp. OV329 TaxID=1882825 RepID=UPI0008E9C6CA|nr:zinc-ribbon and DUF3426 domain-containing protein [Variovorax sp. OV329]SFM15809.1 MJ0042 family finger-like domain-containing protein [Variovorax sp. OV329]
MRLVTRCPACATTFKVVRDQLRISEGWVRCGRCSEVFDATLDLLETDDDGVLLESSKAAPPAPVAAPQPTRAAQENLLPASAGLPAIHWPAADMLDLGARTPAPQPAPESSLPSRTSTPYDAAQDPVPVPSLDDDEEEFNDSDGEQKEPWLDEMMASTQALQEALQSMPASLDTGATPLAETQRREPEFTPSLTAASPIEEAVNAQVQKALRRERLKALRKERAEQKERERAARIEPLGEDFVAARAAAPAAVSESPDLAETVLLEAPSASSGMAVDVDITQPERPGLARRMLWALACVLALAVLVLQVAYQERDTLVAREPRLRPALQALCDVTGCQLSALRQIGSITIDGASFSREKEGEGYRLVFALRNGARMPLAMPSIELTLLDTQERALVRRVMSPAQFGAGTVLGAGAEHNASLPLQLAGSDAVGLPPVAGYRLIAFYP